MRDLRHGMVLSRTILFWSRRALAAEDGLVRSVLGSAGFDVECVTKGMGEIPEFRRSPCHV